MYLLAGVKKQLIDGYSQVSFIGDQTSKEKHEN